MVKEEWTYIPGYKNMYEVSTLGNIKSLKNSKEIILKESIDGRGYSFVKLYIEGKGKNYKHHKAVMLAFVGEPNGKQVNHIDGNKRNNKLDNLEYCTISENQLHAYKLGLSKPKMSALGVLGESNKLSKKVGKFNLNGELLEEGFMYDFKSKYGYDRTNLVRVCNGVRNLAYGFKWKYI